MNNLLTAIFSKISGSSFSSDIGGRIFLDNAPDNTEFPYCVVFIVSDMPEYTFPAATAKGNLEEIIIQFSLFSASAGMTEITGIYEDLRTLFDDCTLTIPPTGTETYALIWMKRENLTVMVDEIITKEGTVGVKHWAVDYNILMEKT